MREESIEIGSPGIQKALRKYNAPSAIAEFIWNGFDAGASVVDIHFEEAELGPIGSLKITDNGSGISSHERFKPFLHKNRLIDPDAIHHGPSATHGKNGMGRLTFFKFAESAKWVTTYKSSANGFRRYSIKTDIRKLNKFTHDPEIDSGGPAGTTVEFSGIWELSKYSFGEVKDFLLREFAWFLELASPFPRTITVNGKGVDYKRLVGEKDEFTLEINGETFFVKYVRWQHSLHNEYSRYYFAGADNRERAKLTTSFNNKGDGFYHSVYVKSSYFDPLKEGITLHDPEEKPDIPSLPFEGLERDDTFRELRKRLDDYLRRKRRPFLSRRAKKFVEELEKDNIFPDFGTEPWEQHRKRELTEIVKELYEADPRIFNNLNNQQKQTLVHLFSLVMNSSERDHLLEVLTQVVNLDSKDRADLANILKKTQLSNLIATIKLIEDRFIAVAELREMVFRREFDANERDHLQTQIGRHYWLFGEQYHLATAAEPDFEQALRRYVYLLSGEDRPHPISHPDKNKEMDIFAVRWLKESNQINSVVVELKHRDITLSEKELSQVKTYMSVILGQPEFNAGNMTWEFYLVGNKYDNYIKGELESATSHGERHLVHKRTNPSYKIYVLTWSEVFASFELRHNFLLEKLKLEREKLASHAKSADDVLIAGHTNTAALRGATVPII